MINNTASVVLVSRLLKMGRANAMFSATEMSE